MEQPADDLPFEALEAAIFASSPSPLEEDETPQKREKKQGDEAVNVHYYYYLNTLSNKSCLQLCLLTSQESDPSSPCPHPS